MATTLYLGFSPDADDGFIEVEQHDFDSWEQAWAYALGDDGGNLTALSLAVDALARRLDIPAGWHAYCVCQTDGRHDFCLWLGND